MSFLPITLTAEVRLYGATSIVINPVNKTCYALSGICSKATCCIYSTCVSYTPFLLPLLQANNMQDFTFHPDTHPELFL